MMISGADGDGVRFAMRIMIEFATAVGAMRLLPISRAHIDSCLYHGRSGLDFAWKLVEGGAKVAVPTTLNVGAVDLLHPELNRGDRTSIKNGKDLMEAYKRMGCRPTWTCAPYQLADRPSFGEQVAWAESNAIVFINSVVGARTSRYGDLIDICAAVTGRVPDYGLHRIENRRGDLIIDVSNLPLLRFRDELVWPLLGLIVGLKSQSHVPVIVGVPVTVTEDQLKAFGAAAASSGSVALFHMVGITPEAPSIVLATQGVAPTQSVIVTESMLSWAQRELTTQNLGRMAAVSVGTPHFSRSESETLLKLANGRRRHPDVDFYVSIGRDTLREIEDEGLLAPLMNFGVEFVTDTCTYLKPIMRVRPGLVMTNSAKWAYYAPGNLGFDVVFATLSDCVESAVAGEVRISSPRSSG